MPEWTRLIGIAAQAAILLLVIAVGLRASWWDVTYLFRHPVLLAKSVAARNVLVPFAALLIASVFPMAPAVRAAILVLSISAVPPTLPKAGRKAGAHNGYVLGLLITQSVLAVAVVPLSLSAFNALLGVNAQFAPRAVVPLVARLTLLPLIIGVVIRYAAESRADRLAELFDKIGGALLALVVIAIVMLFWRPCFALIGNGTLLALAVYVAAALSIGHALGGPREEDRTALALASSSSHPGLAIAIVGAHLSKPAMGPVVATVVLYLIARALIAHLYVRKRTELAPEEQWRIGGDRRGASRGEPERRRAVG